MSEPLDEDLLPANIFSSKCSSREVLLSITRRWGVLTITALSSHPLRFSELRRKIDGISERMLSQNLRELELHGVIHREVLGNFPPKVQYELTPLGHEIAEHLEGLVEVVYRNIDELTASSR